MSLGEEIIKMLHGEKPQLNNARPFHNFLSVIFQQLLHQTISNAGDIQFHTL